MSEEFVGHTPLTTEWSFYFNKPSKRHVRGKGLNYSKWECTKVYTMHSVEAFWGIQKALISPGSVSDLTLYLFRNDIKPEWENEFNRQGGDFRFEWQRKIHFVKKPGGKVPSTVEKPNGIDAHVFDELWLHAMLVAIGESAAFNHRITGLACQVRSNCYRITIWTCSTDESEMRSLGNSFHETFINAGVPPERYNSNPSFTSVAERIRAANHGGEPRALFKMDVRRRGQQHRNVSLRANNNPPLIPSGVPQRTNNKKRRNVSQLSVERSAKNTTPKTEEEEEATE
ncbi:hypothetical protein PCE1_002331 [Barthelona sp. PCE]